MLKSNKGSFLCWRKTLKTCIDIKYFNLCIYITYYTISILIHLSNLCVIPFLEHGVEPVVADPVRLSRVTLCLVVRVAPDPHLDIWINHLTARLLVRLGKVLAAENLKSETSFIVLQNFLLAARYCAERNCP
jgi:hypothetical protein